MSIEIGELIEGKVSGIKPFGAFVDLPENKSGMIHISEVAQGYVKNINDYLSIGDIVTVKVIKLTDDGKINLSLRHEQVPQESKGVEPSKTEEPRTSRSEPEKKQQSVDDFDRMMSQFLKDSEDRLTSLKRSTEGKRGGRGGRRG